MDDGYVHFDGDPATDSRRRHLERVLQGNPPRRKWPWILAALAGGAWAFWRLGRPRDQPPETAAPARAQSAGEAAGRRASPKRGGVTGSSDPAAPS